MRSLIFLALAACGESASNEVATVEFSTRLEFTGFEGRGPSPLDQLMNRTIELEIEYDEFGIVRAEDDPCKSLTFFGSPRRTARGDTAELVEQLMFATLVDWDLTLDLCADQVNSRLLIVSAVNELNLVMGCLMVPDEGHVRDDLGYPLFTTFVGTACEISLLDVVNNRLLSARDFTISVATKGPQAPE